MGNIGMRSIRIILLVVFAIASIATFSLSIFLPAFRSASYAPLREMILPEPDPIVIYLLYSTEKQAWLEETLPGFYATDSRVNGRPVLVEMSKAGSREIYLDVLNGRQPDIISTASSLQISILETLSSNKFGASIVDRQDPSGCQVIVQTPLVLVAWKERADALWGTSAQDDTWLRLQEAVVNPQGWAGYNHPEWGYVKFGQTSPMTSNSGFQTILLMTYAYHRKSSGLTAQDILSDQGYQDWFINFQRGVPQFGDSTGTYMRDIVAYGPSAYDFVAVYESIAIEQIANARGRYGDLKVYYPDATLMSDHPFCILKGDWVTIEKRQAAEVFLNYLASQRSQELAMMKFGYRPVDPSISLNQFDSPFVKYADSGFQINIPPSVEVPPGNVLDTLLEFWNRNIRP